MFSNIKNRQGIDAMIAQKFFTNRNDAISNITDTMISKEQV